MLKIGIRLQRILLALCLLALPAGMLTGCAKSEENPNAILEEAIRETDYIIKYLQDTKQDSGITLHPSGLVYKVLNKGYYTDTISLEEIPVVTFTRRLLGKEPVIESSPLPTSFDNRKLKDHIPGWQYGLPMISKGGRIQLFIPSRLAFGNVGIPGKIPPNAILFCDITLIDIRK